MAVVQLAIALKTAYFLIFFVEPSRAVASWLLLLLLPRFHQRGFSIRAFGLSISCN